MAIIQELVSAGSDVRARNNSGAEPLHMAAAFNKNAEAAAAAVHVLISSGADVNAADLTGHQPLHAAAGNPRLHAAAAAVQILVTAGSDLNGCVADGSRPLHRTAGCLVPALLLVRLGASLWQRDIAGRTALEAAGGSMIAEAALRRAAASERLCTGCGAGGERLKRCHAASYCRWVVGLVWMLCAVSAGCGCGRE